MKRVGVIGASGYAGHELVKLLKHHGQVELSVLNSHSFHGQRVSQLYPDFTGHETYTGHSIADINAMKLDLIFLALPHGLSMEVAAQIQGPTKLVDLSADYRFADQATYEKVYGQQLLPSSHKWVYGLPELFKPEIRRATAVANPGCYATAAILAAYPIQKLAKHIVFDCKSGWSGAGRESHYARDPSIIRDNLIPYTLTRHRHKYEIEQFIHAPLSFTPHVFGAFQGMLCTAHILLEQPMTSAEAIKVYKQFYGSAAFTRIMEAAPQVRDTQKTNFCQIGGFEIDEANQLVVVSSIDNLWKGAAGQAVQNMNLMLGFKETAGLIS